MFDQMESKNWEFTRALYSTCGDKICYSLQNGFPNVKLDKFEILSKLWI